MSILKQVIEEYGIFQIAKAPPDTTDTSPSVGSVSEWSELLENQNGELTEEELPAAIEMVAIIEMRESGAVPDHYTATTECRRCGPVPIWEGCAPQVTGCPWCLNRIKGLPIPRAEE